MIKKAGQTCFQDMFDRPSLLLDFSTEVFYN